MTSDSSTIEISDPEMLVAAPLVSVYMLAYRHERFIHEAIEGVLAQQCDFPIELIIGEDCSPDRTMEIAIDYQKRFPQLIRVLTSDGNVGAYANARRCLLAARGNYVAICEGDDFWHHPNKLQMQVDLMERHPSMTVCHTDFDRLTKFRRRRSCHKRHPSPWLAKGDAYVSLLNEWSVMTATSLYRRDVLTAFSGSIYDNPAWPFGDRNKLLFASLSGPFGYIDESTATFRKRVGSAMNSGAASSLAMAESTLECIGLFVSTHPPDADTARLALAKVHQMIYHRAYRAGDMEKMDKAFDSLTSNGTPIPHFSHWLRQLAIRVCLPVRLQNGLKEVIDRYLSGT